MSQTVMAGQDRTGKVSPASLYVSPDGRGVVVQSNGAILFSDDFGGTTLNTTTSWDVLDGGLGANPTLHNQKLTQSAIGSGVNMGNGVNGSANTALSVSASALTITLGTTASAELWLLSQQMFAGTEDLFFTLLKSQAIAANSIFVGLVEVDPTTGIPIYNANTPSYTINAVAVPAYFTNMGGAELGLQTVNTSYASVAIGDSSSAGAPGSTATALAAMTGNSEWLAEFTAEDIIVSNSAVDSVAGRNAAPSRVSTQSPNDGKAYKVLVRFRNIGTPGSSTTVTLGRLMIWDRQEMRVEVASGRGDQTAQKAVAVNIASGVPAGSNTIGGVTAVKATSGGLSLLRLSAATAVTGVVKASAGQLYSYDFLNTSAGIRYVHFYAQTTAPTLGTSTPVYTLGIPAGARANGAFDIGWAIATGIAYAITTDDAANPATGATAGDVQGTVGYA